MEMATQSFSYAKSKSLSPFIAPKSTVLSHKPVNFVGYNCLPRKLTCSTKQFRNFGAVSASDSDTSPPDDSARWLLQPIGNGDTRHIGGYKVAMPGAFEIASSVVTVGRVREKADIVLRVPTVSAVHARIQKTEDNLLITDLESTNGTFIGEKRLQPGVSSAALPGNLVTFGDTNLAIFRVYKLEKEDFSTESQESGDT
ncbi:hypothetical protein F511_19357 [Dorcoceras hygrometricum]|uniref:FHA domain-containing protein n=1 Tax=Dorcoceras hygrometricum TaxID=472368 RepID=A0A2Z7CI77_9LAMI|nr:hypothetical protein F511_19357 [Dorcoceras hygrometricum]